MAAIGCDGKGSLNRLESADSSKGPSLIAKEKDSKLPSDEKDIVHELQVEAIIVDDESIKILKVNGGQTDFSPSNQEPIAPAVLSEQVIPVGQTGLTSLDQQVRPVSQTSQIGSGLKSSEITRPEHPVVNGVKDHVKHNGKRLKLTFDELLDKYQKNNEVKRANRLNCVKSSRLPPKHNSGNWNWQEKRFHSAASCPPFGPSMPIPYAPHSTSFHPYSSWGWNDPWAHTPSHFKPYHVEYASPREPLRLRQPLLKMTVLSKRIGLMC